MSRPLWSIRIFIIYAVTGAQIREDFENIFYIEMCVCVSFVIRFLCTNRRDRLIKEKRKPRKIVNVRADSDFTTVRFCFRSRVYANLPYKYFIFFPVCVCVCV